MTRDEVMGREVTDEPTTAPERPIKIIKDCKKTQRRKKKSLY
jgi:hypothetical protein